jgi:hypothetical protein
VYGLVDDAVSFRAETLGDMSVWGTRFGRKTGPIDPEGAIADTPADSLGAAGERQH